MSKKKNLVVKILVGLPASGKSTYAIEFVKNNPRWVIISRDSFRKMLVNTYVCPDGVELLIHDLVNSSILKALNKGFNVIIDDTNLISKDINDFKKLVKYYADVEYEIFNVDVETCIKRDIIRDREPISREYFLRKEVEFKNLLNIFDFSPTKIEKRPHIFPEFESELPDAIIMDIDGNLAITGDRSVYDGEKAHLDFNNRIVSEQIEFHKTKGRKIIVMSGREEIFKDVTKSWLKSHNIYYDELHMRKKEDKRKDSVIKTELYNDNIKDKYNVLAVYDDRLSVVLNCWNKLGLFTFCTNQGLIEF